jgi:hypothetical protein
VSLKNYIDGDDIEEEKELSSKKDKATIERIDEIMEKFEPWLSRHWKEGTRWRNDFDNAMELLKGIHVHPDDIVEICGLMKRYEDHKFFFNSGHFISALIQISYRDGHRNFRIDTSQLENKISHIGQYISGKEDAHLNLEVNGPSGAWCGHWTMYVNLHFRGEVGNNCACNAIHSSFWFDERVDICCGETAKHCQFYSGDQNLLREIKKFSSKGCRFYLVDGEKVSEVFPV